MNTINLGILEHGPHADLIRDMASKCAADSSIQAVWVGGSLAAGTGDIHSDIDFRIAVEPGQLDKWTKTDWIEQYLPLASCGGIFMRFGEHAMLHHLVLANGVIVDFLVQDTTRQNHEPKLVVLACRNDAFREMLEGFERPPAALVREIEGGRVRPFLVDYWITTHKQMKALARKYDHSPFVGLYFERVALLRAWHMQLAGKDIDSRVSIHMLGALHKGLGDQLSEDRHNILGMPSRTPEETIAVIDAIRAEMAEVGRWLAERYGFDYPHALEEVVRQAWDEHRASLTKR